jgi:hypothetical protein
VGGRHLLDRLPGAVLVPELLVLLVGPPLMGALDS